MKKTFLRAVALSAIITFGMVNMGFAVGGSIGHGNISVYKNGQLETKLTGQNPLEDEALLVCDGKCIVKSEGVSLIGADKSQIAVKNESERFNLFVKEGKVDYVINSNARTIAFHTPQGTYTVAEAVFDTNGSSAVKGTVTVNSDGETEIAVTEGRLVFATSDGMRTVDENNSIVLAMADVGAGLLSGPFVGIAAGAAFLGGIAALEEANDNDDNDDNTSDITDSGSSSGSSSSSGSGSSSGSDSDSDSDTSSSSSTMSPSA